MVQPAVAPNVTQGADMALQPEGGIVPTGQNFDKLKGDWMEFLQRPEVISGMLQFGASALAGSNPGVALSEAAQAASGTREAIQQRGQESVRQNLATREVTGREAAQAENVRANRAQEGLAERGLQQKQDEFAKTMGLEFEKLGVEKSRAATYANYMSQLGGKAGRTIPGYTDAVRAAMQNLSLQYDPGTPEWEQALQSTMGAINSAFGVSQPTGTPTVPGSETVPAPQAAAPEIPTVTTPQDYAKIPWGSQYKDPQGNIRVKPLSKGKPVPGQQ